MSDGELDYKTMFENLSRFVKRQIDAESEYFLLLRKTEQLSVYSEEIGKRITEIKIADQVKMLRQAVKLMELEKQLCEKYGIEVDEVKYE